MQRWCRIGATFLVIATLVGCASVDKRFGDEAWYQKAHQIAVKSVDATTVTATKSYQRMQKYLSERDLLKTFQDAGEHSETAVLGVLHKAGIAKRSTTPVAPGNRARTPLNGAPKKIQPPSAPSTVPERYAGKLRWPVDAGIISSEYGERWGKMHNGLDIAADIGEPVYAITAGEVIYAGDGLRGYGNVVIIRHDQRISSLYAHNTELKVKQGEQVGQGSLIALLGSTGHSTGPHVHFEIRDGDAAVNPHTLLPASQLADSAETLEAANERYARVIPDSEQPRRTATPGAFLR